jgi:hypothetical protein
MTQKQQTTTTGQYNQPSMGVFNQLTPQFGQAIGSEITNPYSNMFFNQQLGMGQQQLGAQGASANQALLQRAQAMGVQGNSPLMMSQMGQNQRAGMAGQSNLFNNLLMQAGQMRQSALGMAGSYRPLQTGQVGVEQTSGLGSWLPQLAGAGLGAAGAFFGKQQSQGPGSTYPGASYMPGDYQNQPTGNLPMDSQLNMGSPFWGLQQQGQP